MASTLKVFGLPGHTDDAELLQMFAVFGPVASASLCDEEGSTQRSGLVTFGTHQAALAAMSHMKGRHHRGACLSVQLAGFSELHGAGAGGDGPTRQRVAGGRLVGTVSSWLGAYGWIEPDGRLDHSAAGKHDGKVFLSSRDLGAAPPPKPGDRLSFALYFDSDGLGAHEVGPPDKGGGPGRVAVDAAVALLPGSVEVRVLGWPPSLEDAFPKTFAHFGTVCSHTFERPQRQGARSSGAVTFSSLHSARLAVEAMDGKPYGGKPLSVRFADPEQEKAARPLAPPAAPPGGGAAAARSPGGGPLVRSEGPDQRHTGTVRQWTATKHFGWIAPDGPLSVQDPQGRKDVYFERRDLEGEAPAKLRVGSRVSFQRAVFKEGALQHGALRLGTDTELDLHCSRLPHPEVPQPPGPPSLDRRSSSTRTPRASGRRRCAWRPATGWRCWRPAVRSARPRRRPPPRRSPGGTGWLATAVRFRSRPWRSCRTSLSGSQPAALSRGGWRRARGSGAQRQWPRWRPASWGRCIGSTAGSWPARWSVRAASWTRSPCAPSPAGSASRWTATWPTLGCRASGLRRPSTSRPRRQPAARPRTC
ncbi:unnamed protein product [Prorocentrum cordatum]|uniref:RRM domain-containing protein n=1 Tax=Prorocentrum cordatum TaxID=2364126 RepID=A0ABN9YDF0_9DINO|nr:unnamed protein product [Polarella glacialis]